MLNNTIFGKDGEEMAAAFMMEKGFEILAKNYRSGRAEIDLILKKESLLVFAEVKLRSKVGKFGLPEDAVNGKKEDLIMGAAENYILDNDWKGDVRFDIISIIYKKGIYHIEDAFG
jgi:putative endonuclease